MTERGGLRIRRLAYGDLPSVISIERRSFPTPWSLAMFVLELSKPSGICLAAEDEDGLVGYLVCARYDEVWHLMNVAVNPEHRRRGIAPELIERLFEEAGSERALHARGPRLEPAGDRDVRGLRLPLRRPPPPLLPRQRRGRPDHVARGERDASRRRLSDSPMRPARARDELRRHLRRRHRRRADPLQRRLLAGRLPRALRRRRPGGRLAPSPRARQRGRRRGARARRGPSSPTSTPSRSPRARA